MIKIGEKCDSIKKLKSKCDKDEKRAAVLNRQISETKNAICELEKSKLPIKILVAIEDHRVPESCSSSSDDVHWVSVYYFPDIDTIHAERDYSWGKKQIYPNEINLSTFYKSGCDTLDAKLPFGEHFMDGKKHQSIIKSAISDVKRRIERILEKNNNIDDWDLIGKLILASYYNL